MLSRTSPAQACSRIWIASWEISVRQIRGREHVVAPRCRAYHRMRQLQCVSFMMCAQSALRIRHTPVSAMMIHRQQFTLSNFQHKAKAIFNPRKDDEGNEMSLEITPRASKRLKEIMTQDANPNLALRIQVENGGCHGFQYLMSLTTIPQIEAMAGMTKSQDSQISAPLQSQASPLSNTDQSSDKPRLFLSDHNNKESNQTILLGEDDTIFVAPDDSGAKVILDRPSLEILAGSKVDYTTELIGSQFKIVDNPLATSSCGCGTSFDIG
ncbi:iron sulfur assembly protein [Blumeria hordei DH14]|uniref:Iron sulfur assembly protein n=1 Tax=Blumeria graminis f. sp. hordei (strain DH14) TaxID=546991 RepID=N1J9Z0_BLUG1|nr:iron sulfur assembly protein [Blumeria hordei DH14]